MRAFTRLTGIQFMKQWGCRQINASARMNFGFNTTANKMRGWRSEEHTSELQSRSDLVCRLLLEKKKKYAAHQIHARRRGHARHIREVTRSSVSIAVT